MDVQIDRSHLLCLLERFLLAHAPPGAEGEVDAIVLDTVRPYADAVWQDAADSIVIHIRGQADSAPIAVTAHKDEIALIVKRIEEDGRLRVRPLGGLHPGRPAKGPSRSWAMGNWFQVFFRWGPNMCPTRVRPAV